LPDQVPPGQYVPKRWPVLHYGRIPYFNPQKWTLRVCGATPGPVCWTWAEFGRLPRVDVIADFHCVTKFTLLGNRWTGVSTAQVLAAASPADGVSHVMVYGEYGYSANLRLADFAAADSLLATHRNGDLLTAEHGHPVRLVVPHLYAWKGPKWVRAIEYLTEDRRGFWEERGYHNLADPWREQRYSYQEDPSDGPSA
jgi:DMSO/TMAO reductase YedYZ molybdopterin-dependent catalytic subunit